MTQFQLLHPPDLWQPKLPRVPSPEGVAPSVELLGRAWSKVKWAPVGPCWPMLSLYFGLWLLQLVQVADWDWFCASYILPHELGIPNNQKNCDDIGTAQLQEPCCGSLTWSILIRQKQGKSGGACKSGAPPAVFNVFFSASQFLSNIQSEAIYAVRRRYRERAEWSAHAHDKVWNAWGILNPWRCKVFNLFVPCLDWRFFIKCWVAFTGAWVGAC